MLRKDFVTTKPGMVILDRAHTMKEGPGLGWHFANLCILSTQALNCCLCSQECDKGLYAARQKCTEFSSWFSLVKICCHVQKGQRGDTKESALSCMMMSVFQISSQSLIHGNFFSHLHRLYQVFLSNHFFQDLIAKKLHTFTIIPLLRVCFEICGCAIHMNEGYLLCFYSQFPLQEYYTRLDLIS